MSDSPHFVPDSEHPPAEEMAAYLSAALSPPDRARIESHLASCGPCRRQATTALRTLRTVPHRPLTARMTVPAVAVAAAVVLAVLQPWQRATARPGASLRAADEVPAAGALVALAPADGDTLLTAWASFAWRAHRHDTMYRFTLMDDRARVVWTVDTGDTTLALPDSVTLARTGRYVWFVDALGVDGLAGTTGMRRFVTPP